MANRIPKSNSVSTTSKESSGLGLYALQENAEKQFQQVAVSLKEQLGPATASNGDYQRQDAFRHAFSAAVVTREIASTINNLNPGNTELGQRISLEAAGVATATLGRGLEGLSVIDNGRDNNNHADIGMDIHNNQRGIAIAKELGINATDKDFARAVAEDMTRGNLILSNEDPRALAKFEEQFDMRALQASRDTTTGAAQYVNAAIESGKQFASNTWEQAKNSTMFASAQDSQDSQDNSKHATTAHAYKAPEEKNFGQESTRPTLSTDAIEKALDAINKESPFLSQEKQSATTLNQPKVPEGEQAQRRAENELKSQDMSMGE